MSARSILSWITSGTAKLLPSPSRTRSLMVAATVRAERPNLATLGRQLAGPTTATSVLKRIWRYLNNDRIEVADPLAGVIARLVPNHKKRLSVSVDGTDARASTPGWRPPASAAEPCRGCRPAIPSGRKLLRSQNSLEEGLLRRLRTWILASVPVVILVDRGFGRAEWAAVCQDLGFRYVVRGSSRRCRSPAHAITAC